MVSRPGSGSKPLRPIASTTVRRLQVSGCVVPEPWHGAEELDQTGQGVERLPCHVPFEFPKGKPLDEG